MYITDRAGGGAGSTYIHRADGTGVPRLLLRTEQDFGQLFPTRDGRWLLFRTAATGGGNGDIMGLRAGDTTLVPLVATPSAELFPAVSPDGRWLAYSSNESGSGEVYVRPFPETGSAKWQVSTAGGGEPTWSPSGRELFYVNGKAEMVSAEITPGAAFGVGRQRTMFSVSQLYRPGPIPMYSLTPDGQRFLMVREGGGLAAERAGGGGELAAAAESDGGEVAGASGQRFESGRRGRTFPSPRSSAATFPSASRRKITIEVPSHRFR